MLYVHVYTLYNDFFSFFYCWYLFRRFFCSHISFLPVVFNSKDCRNKEATQTHTIETKKKMEPEIGTKCSTQQNQSNETVVVAGIFFSSENAK